MPFIWNVWYITNVNYSWAGGQLDITATTDKDISLTCRISYGAPYKTLKWVTVRGTRQQCQVSYYSTKWADYLQLEPGDTKTHTWHISLPPDVKIWNFYFYGRVFGEDYVSASPFYDIDEKVMPLKSLGIFSDPIILKEHVKLQTAGNLTITLDEPTKTFTIAHP